MDGLAVHSLCTMGEKKSRVEMTTGEMEAKKKKKINYMYISIYAVQHQREINGLQD